MRLSIVLILSTLATYSAVSQEISSSFPFKSQYQRVNGSTIHFVEEYGDKSNPEQTTFLFLHGNPTSSYLWRNIIPYVKGHGRAIAIDLIGMGQSDKPDLDYTFQDHYTYVSGFIEAKGLKNVVLVLHDWGSGLGFHYASRHPENVKGIVFMEAITKPVYWKDTALAERFIFKRLRDPKKGHKMIAENNFFIEKILFKMGVKRKLTEQEKIRYSAPYPTVESRKPIEVWPREIPIDGTPQRNFKVVENYAKWLESNDLPKLLIYAKPGMIIKKKDVGRIESTYSNLETVFIGKGKHYIQEDHPHEIGLAIQQWVEQNKL